MKLVVGCQLSQPSKFLSNTKHSKLYEEVMTELFFESISRKSINLKNLAFELAVAIFDIEPKNMKLILCQSIANATYFHTKMQSKSYTKFI